MNHHSRRDFIKTGALGSLLIGTGIFAGAACTSVKQRGKAKNVIFLVSDGMSVGALTMADHVLRRRDGKPSNWIRLLEEGKVRQANMDMASANALVTDSAAASCSWGCGHRVNNGSVNIGVNGETHKPILPIFGDAGRSTGLVTTAEITHATPAGFAANVESRNMAEKIAEQYLDRRLDVLMGGGDRRYNPEKRSDNKDLYAEYRAGGYHVVTSKQEIGSRLPDAPFLGVFDHGHVPYTIDHLHTPELMESVPTLAEMTELAIQKLSSNPNGFILQVEGARVDHAAHSNDPAGLIYDQIAFDNAIQTALDFTENRDDTLVIITTDHGNSNPGLSSGSNSNFDKINHFKHSSEWVRRQLNESSSVSRIKEVMEEATRLQLADLEATAMRDVLRGVYTHVASRRSGMASVYGEILSNHTNITWASTSHTSDYVELASYGPGSEALEGYVKNTDLFRVMVEAAGIEERFLTFEEEMAA
ncbi:MAG: alkaline phosphatase [Balneolaceae bacterium]|nr:MAG: alkaline phosphatase [Balneolaceae bacterium]